MKKMLFVPSVVLAAMLAGCGEDSAASKKAGDLAGKYKSAAAVGREYSPQVCEKAEGTLIWTANDASALAPLNDAFVKCFKKGMDRKLAGGGTEADNFAKFLDFLEKSGLSKTSVDWFSVSAGDFNIDGIVSGADIPAAAASIAFAHDLDRIFETLKECAPEGKDFLDAVEKVSVEGCNGYKFPKNDDQPVDIFFVSLDGRVLVIGDGERAVAGEIALLRDGKGASKTYAGVPEGCSVSVYLPRFGRMVAKAADAAGGGLEVVDMVIPDGQRMLKDFKSLTFNITASAKVKLSVEVETGSESDASTIKTVLSSFIALGKVQIPASDTSARAKASRAFYDGLKLEADGAKLLLALEVPEDAVDFIAKEMLTEAGAED